MIRWHGMVISSRIENDTFGASASRRRQVGKQLFRMRSPVIATLLAAGSVAAISQHQPGWENVLSARQAFREIHDHLLGEQLSTGKVSQVKLGLANDQLESVTRNTTGWTGETLKEDARSTRIKAKQEDPEDQPRGEPCPKTCLDLILPGDILVPSTSDIDKPFFL